MKKVLITNKFAAIPIFLIIMLFIFYVSFGPIGTFCQSFARDIINKVYIMTLGILKTKWDIVQNIVKYIIQKKIVSAKELEKFFK